VLRELTLVFISPATDLECRSRPNWNWSTAFSNSRANGLANEISRLRFRLIQIVIADRHRPLATYGADDDSAIELLCPLFGRFADPFKAAFVIAGMGAEELAQFGIIYRRFFELILCGLRSWVGHFTKCLIEVAVR